MLPKRSLTLVLLLVLCSEGDLMVPLGHMAATGVAGSLRYNEFIVYNINQVRRCALEWLFPELCA